MVPVPDAAEFDRLAVGVLVLCHGTFDYLHVGHKRHFQAAKALGDFLVVTLTADEFINKGPGRPIFTHDERAEMIQALRYVDMVEVCHHKTGLPMIEKFKPSIYAKGGDYTVQDKHGSLECERLAVEAHGGRLVLTEHGGFSSSMLIERLRRGIG